MAIRSAGLRSAAGRRPGWRDRCRRTAPTATPTPNASATEYSCTTGWTPTILNRLPTSPASTPSTPPSIESSTASARNWPRMSLRRAPIALRMPISRVRSVTVTSMMFITPIPPTSSEIAATAASSTVNVWFVAFVVCSSDAWLSTLKVGAAVGARVVRREDRVDLGRRRRRPPSPTSPGCTIWLSPLVVPVSRSCARRERRDRDVVLILDAVRALRRRARRRPGTTTPFSLIVCPSGSGRAEEVRRRRSGRRRRSACWSRRPAR